MNEEFVNIISKILLVEKENVSLELSRDEVEEWDSMTHLVLISDVEEEYDVQFEDEEVVEVETVKDLVMLLQNYGVNIK